MRKNLISECPCCKGEKDKRANLCRNCKDNSAWGPEKLCRGCNQTLPIENFSPRMKRSKLTTRSRCNACGCAAAKAWRENNPEKATERKRAWEKNNPEKHYRATRRRHWRGMGFDPDVVEQLYANSSGCEICGDTEAKLVVDHCHTTGALRGLLCNRCNTGIGQLRDNPTILAWVSGSQTSPDASPNYIRFAHSLPTPLRTESG